MSESPATIERAYRVRLYPKPAQARTLRRLLGARRFIWNWALRTKDEAWRADCTKLGAIELSRLFTVLRSTGDTAWLATLPRQPFDQTLRDFDRAWKNFFAGRAERPRRRRFGTVNSMRFTLDQRQVGLVDLTGDRHGSVQLSRLGRVQFRRTEAMAGRLRSVTVSLDAAGRWHASFTADGVPAPALTAAPADAVGVDLGLKDVAVLSTGEKIAAGRHLWSAQAKLRRYQRHYVRQRAAAARRQGLDPAKPFPKGTRVAPSRRMRRTLAKVGRLHAKVADHRRDFHHQLTARLVAGAAVICMEDLAVKAMARGMGRRAFRRSVADAGLGEIRRQVQYKAAWRGRIVSMVDRFYPSSKTCGHCGYVYAGLKLSERHWVCPVCGTRHDRDINAAKNIEREGLRLLAGKPVPAGDTPRIGEIDARGEHACAAGRTSPSGQPNSMNRELAYRVATLRTARQHPDGRAPRAEG